MTDQRRLSDKSIKVLSLIADGHSYGQIVDGHSDIRYHDIFHAAEEALRLYESQPDHHARLAQIKLRYSRAYEPWTADDDAQLATLPSRPMGQQTHPTTPVLAAALALAESRRATGAALLNSYIVGLEVACRLGDAVDPSHYLDGFHPTGTLGAFGATAACAQLLRLSPLSIRHALGIAGTLASGLRANRGTMAKGLNAGRAAENGVIATTLAADGFTASENIFDDPMGFFSAACRVMSSTNPFILTQP